MLKLLLLSLGTLGPKTNLTYYLNTSMIFIDQPKDKVG